MSVFFRRYQKAIIWIVVLSFFVGGVALLSANQAGLFSGSNNNNSTTQNIAIVNGTAIPTSTAETAATNLLNQYKYYYQQLGQDPTDQFSGAKGKLLTLDIRAQALNQVIREALYAQAAKERKIRVTKQQINDSFTAQYDQVLSSNSLTEDQLSTILVQQGQTLASFKDSLRAQVEVQLRDTALQNQIVGVINPTDDELEQYFEANISNYDTAESIRASHILVSDEATAQDIYNQLMAGADFATLARQYSQDTGTRDNGGDLGWFSRGDMVQEFEDAAFALDVGQISEPVKTQYGYHIIMVTDRMAASTPTLDDVKDQVRNDYISQETSDRFSAWYQDYHDAADIQILDPLLNAYLLQNSDLDAAIAEYERLLANNEVSDPYFEYYIGRAYEKRALNYASERAPLEDEENPTDADLARIDELKALGKADEQKALEHYLNALKEDAVQADEAFVNRVLLLDPNSNDARYVLGELYADRGDAVDAEAQFDQIINDSPDYIRAYIASGDLALKIGQSQKAIFRFEDALALEPQDTSTQVALMIRLANAHLDVDELDDADSYVQQAEALDPANAQIIVLKGDIAAARLSHAIDDRDALQAVAERTSEQDVQLADTEVLISNLENQAVGYYQSAIQKLGSMLDLEVKLGNVYLAADRLDDAESQFRMILMRSPYRVDAYQGLAETLIKKGDTQGGLDNLYSALARSFDDTEKEQIAARILDFAPDDVATRLQYAQLLAKGFKWSAAIREYGTVLAAEPTNIDAYLGIAEAYSARLDDATALEYLQRGLNYATYDSQKVQLYLAMITAYQSEAGAGQPLSDDGQDARIELAKLYISQSQDAKALEQLQAVQKDEPSYRLDEINALIVQAGGTVELPVSDTGTDTPPQDNTSAGSTQEATPATDSSSSDTSNAAQ